MTDDGTRLPRDARGITARAFTGLRRHGTALTVSALIVVLVWQAVAVLVSHARNVPFPTPWHTVLRLAALLGGSPLLGHSVYVHVLSSLLRWAAGFALAALAGLSIGIAAGWWPRVDRVTLPIVSAVHLVPGLAWIPVALLVFGIGAPATIFMIALTAFAPIAISVTGGVKRVEDRFVRAALMMGAGRRALFIRVLVPGALPQILTGLRVGLGNGWRVLVAAEMVVGTGTGLGYAIIQSRWTLDYTAAFACIGIICTIGLVVERLVFATLERRTVEVWGLRRER